MQPLFIDVHSHLDHPWCQEDIEGIITRAKNAGVRHIVTNGIDPKTNRLCLELSKKYDIVKCAMGLYPRDALKKELEGTEWKAEHDFDRDSEITFIESHAKDIVAISEIGLDFVHGFSQRQVEDFEAMLELAKRLDKPVVIHSRKAEEQCIEIMEAKKMKKVVLHCFCGKKSLVKRALQNNWSITIPTTVVRAQQFQDVIREASLSQLFCETDSPYLSPFKEKRNEPAFVLESYKKIAEIKKMTVEEVAQHLYLNWQRMFT